MSFHQQHLTVVWIDGHDETFSCGGFTDACVVEDGVLSVTMQNGPHLSREVVVSVPLINVRKWFMAEVS